MRPSASAVRSVRPLPEMAFYFAYGEYDAYVITDFPDAAAGLAVSLAVNASGAVRLSTIPLITPEEIDTACKRSVAYRAPGA